MTTTELIQGNTTTITFQSKNDDGSPLVLLPSMRIMVLIYNSIDMILFEARYPETIERVDDITYCVQIPHEVTKNFQGKLTMEFSAYSADMVTIAKNKIEMFWVKNLSSKKVRK